MTKRILALILTAALLLLAVPAVATDMASDAVVYLTVSDRGVIADAADGTPMVNRAVTVSDLDEDGKLTVHEVLIAAHETYLTADGYAISDSDVTKLWGADADNVLFFINHVGLSTGVTFDTVSQGDTLVASLNQDNTYWADWYTFFDTSEKAVATDEAFMLTVKGHLGMTYPPEEVEDVALSGLNIGTVEDSTFTPLTDKVTDAEGKVTLSFAAPGTYYVSASGTVSDSVTDYTTGQTVTADCPIIAPVCKVTVTEPVAQMSDAEAVACIYNEFAGKNINKYTISATPLLFPLQENGKTYTNIITYIKDWALRETGRDVTVNYTPATIVTAFADWRSGSKVNYIPAAFNANGEMAQNYYKDNAPYSQRLVSTSFTVGTETSATVASIYGKVTSLQRSNQEIVDFVAANLPFARIRGKNTSADVITQTLGETSSTGAVGTLPTKDALYTATSATIAWSLEHVSGSEDALQLKNNKITVLRPNVGEADARFKLTATVTSVADTTLSKSVSYDLTVPAFDVVTIPIQVTEGATLTLTDNYYKAPVDARYILQQDTAPDGFDLYHCSLHSAATGGKQSFQYVVEKADHITQSGTINVEATAPTETLIVSLVASTPDDTKLKELTITAPTVSGFVFDPDVTDYTISVAGAQQIKFNATPAVAGASVKITSYYSSVANANKGNLATSAKAITAACYLPDAVSTSVIQITVTAPEGSIQQEQTRVYTVTVQKTAASNPLTGLVLTAGSSGDGDKNNIDAEGVAKEEVLTPSFVAGANEGYHYTVNYFRDTVTVKPTASGCTITVNGTAVNSGRATDPIALSVGDNTITVSVTKDNVTTDYTITVHRKENLHITNVTLDEGALGTVLSTDGSDWTGSCNFANNTDVIHVTYHTNVTDGVIIRVISADRVYQGVPGEPITLPVGDNDKWMPTTQVLRNVNGTLEGVEYVISYRRLPDTAPNVVESYLPAPGQFVNTESYQNPGKTLSGAGMVTLGAYGGNIVYRYDEPIQNDSNNPYGIDFIVVGNCFANGDRTTSSGAAEPSAVMVSQDGETWYELAGSEYYTASARHNLTITYENEDTTFSAAADTPWTNSDQESGIMPKNAYHSQPYYPNPSTYNVFQSGVGKNESFTAEQVSFTGTMIETGFYPFGYADSHTHQTEAGDVAANPYVANHETVYNGDGFDLSWAVDADGNPVILDEVSYIKIYNPVLNYGGTTGEKSGEIGGVLRAKANNTAVGVSGGLTALLINGEAVSLTEGTDTYTVDGKGASSFVIRPTAQNAEANIYVSNERVVSGADSSFMAAVSKLRVIVQEGEKEPQFYWFNFTNIETPANNAELNEITLTPGDITQSQNTDKTFSFTVANSVSAVRLTPKTGFSRAKITLNGGTLETPISLTSGTASDALALAVGKNTFTVTVTSANGENETVSTVTVERASAGTGTPGEQTIRVNFLLVGDTVHYNAETATNTGAHTPTTWIANTSVLVPKTATVKYLTEMVLNNAGLSYTSDGIYISEIDGLGEMENGPNSGWMYRHNGQIAEEGYADRTLSHGDTIKWFYSDDYTKESGYEGVWDWVNSGTTKTDRETEIEKEDEKTENLPADTPSFNENTFSDVQAEDWHYASVKFVYENRLMQGTGNGFEADAQMTRAMVVTVLHRLAGEKIPEKTDSFTDVSDDAWYADAIAWASANGIVTGTGEEQFSPNGVLSREQLALILYRYAQKAGYTISGSNDLSQFADAGKVSTWSKEAMAWAVGAGLIKGMDDNTLNPSGTATRAQVATILMRFCESVAK